VRNGKCFALSCADNSMQKKREEHESDERTEKKFVRYAEGAEIYGMSLRKFQDFAKEAGAIHKVGKMVLVSCDIIDKYLETFRV